MAENAQHLALPQIGARLGDKYLIERLVGEGVMGAVFEALNVRLDQRVAIKIPQKVVLEDPALVSRFSREARAAARLRHRNSARVFDVDVTDTGTPFIVMELLEGRDLEAEILDRGPLPVEEAVNYVVQACSAMIEAHGQGIVHRDLKPSNLFLAREPDGGVCLKVLDYGISMSQSDRVHLTTIDCPLGTPLYMSPEQVRSLADIDLRTDVWSLGVVLYEMLSGDPPFAGPTLTSVGAAIVLETPEPLSRRRDDLPEGLDAVVVKALSKQPGDRFASAADLQRALLPFLRQSWPLGLRAADSQGELSGIALRVATPIASQVSKELPVPKPVRHRRRRTVVAVGAALVAVLALYGSNRALQNARERVANAPSTHATNALAPAPASLIPPPPSKATASVEPAAPVPPLTNVAGAAPSTPPSLVAVPSAARSRRPSAAETRTGSSELPRQRAPERRPGPALSVATLPPAARVDAARTVAAPENAARAWDHDSPLPPSP